MSPAVNSSQLGLRHWSILTLKDCCVLLVSTPQVMVIAVPLFVVAVRLWTAAGTETTFKINRPQVQLEYLVCLAKQGLTKLHQHWVFWCSGEDKPQTISRHKGDFQQSIPYGLSTIFLYLTEHLSTLTIAAKVKGSLTALYFRSKSIDIVVKIF